MKLKAGDRIEVTWLDSNCPMDKVWHTEEDVQEWEDSAIKLHSIGYYRGKHKGYFNMYGDFYKGDGIKDMFSRIQAIPVGCIKKVKKL